MIGLRFEILEKFLMAFGILYIADLFNVRLLSTLNGILFFIFFIAFLIVYETTAHMHMPYGVE